MVNSIHNLLYQILSLQAIPISEPFRPKTKNVRQHFDSNLYMCIDFKTVSDCKISKQNKIINPIIDYKNTNGIFNY